MLPSTNWKAANALSEPTAKSEPLRVNHQEEHHEKRQEEPHEWTTNSEPNE